MLLNLAVQLAFSGIFSAVEGFRYFGDAFYHCLVTATTVGYGDVSIESDGQQLTSKLTWVRRPSWA